jgi:pimeloyl-ACP methyl ester carboxylesterase
MGGNVAVAAARQLSDRARAVVLVDTYRRLGAPRSAEERRTVMAPFRANFRETTSSYVRGMFPADADLALVRSVAEDMAAAPPDIALAALESNLLFGSTIIESLKEIEAPVTAINADVEPSDVSSLKRIGLEVLTMRGVGHFLMMEDPHSFNLILQQVVSKLRPPK